MVYKPTNITGGPYNSHVLRYFVICSIEPSFFGEEKNPFLGITHIFDPGVLLNL